jgi:hypothetical protein
MARNALNAMGRRGVIPQYVRRTHALRLLLAVALVVITPSLAFAHTPHDEIDLVCLSSHFWHDGTIFAIARAALMASFDAGLTWSRLTRGLPYSRIRSLALPGRLTFDRRVVAATDDSIYFSDDAGRSWDRTRLVGGHFPDPQLHVRESFPRPLVRLATDPDPRCGTMLCILDGSLLVSSDRGASWRRADIGIAGTSAICMAGGTGYAASESGEVVRFGLDPDRVVVTRRWELDSQYPIAVIAKFGATDLTVGTLGNGVWSLLEDSKPRQLGLKSRRITGLWGTDTGQLFATEWDRGVYVSHSGGATWSSRNQGLSRDGQADEAAFRVPHFKAIDGCADQGRRVLFVSGFDGLFRSFDDGHTWQELESLITRNRIVGLAASRANASESRVAVSLYGGGVHSLRGNAHAAGAGNAALQGTRTFAIACHATNDGSDQTWVATHGEVQVISKGVDAPCTVALQRNGRERTQIRPILRRRLARPLKQLLRRAPAGIRSRVRVFLQRSASEVGLDLGVDVFGSVFRSSPDFVNDGTAFLSTWRGGLFRTTDGGRTFRHVGSPPSGAWTLGMDLSPGFPMNGRLYIAAEDGLWIVSARGDTWKRYPELTCGGAAFRVAAAEASIEREVLFVATPRALIRTPFTTSGDPLLPRVVVDCAAESVATDVVLAPDFARSGIALINQAGLGVRRSTDGGLSFAPVQLEGKDFVRDCAHTPGFPDAAPLLAFSPQFSSDDTAYAASEADLLISRDRGANWQVWHTFVHQ